MIRNEETAGIEEFYRPAKEIVKIFFLVQDM